MQTSCNMPSTSLREKLSQWRKMQPALLRRWIKLCRSVGATLLGATTLAAQQPSRVPLPALRLPFHLKSDGHACSGYFLLTREKLVWKYAGGICRGENWKASKEGEEWLVSFRQTPAEAKSCQMGAVSIRLTFPETTDKIWEVTAYKSPAAYFDKQNSQDADLDCSSMY